MSDYRIIDGNEAAAYVAYEFSEIAAIYPISPSSPMAGLTDAWSARGRLNMFGQRVKLTEMQSEAGAIGALHGALEAGALGTSFTASQGLMLMIPTMYRIAGERLPAVLHVASRTVGTHALSILGDHSDVMATRETGFALLSSGSVQEAADLAGIAHLAAIKASIPFLHFFDGYRTSHELSRIDLPDVKALSTLMDQEALDRFRAHALNPEHPMMRAMVQNNDIYFQIREANNTAYDALPGIVEELMAREGEITGRTYHVFDYYGDPDATDVIVAMGSVSGAIQEACDYLNAKAEAEGTGRRYGFVQVHLFRPFSTSLLLAALPASVERIAVLDRCKSMGASGEPLYKDVASAIAESDRASRTLVVGGRYGLSSKDTDTAQMVAVFENLVAKEPIRGFTVGITDDVTHLSLPVRALDDLDTGDVYSCKFWGLGGDGTVGANKNTIKILADAENMFAQAYFEYDSKKSFGVTKSHLRLSKSPIRSTYFVTSADFVACHNQTYMDRYDVVQEIKPGGMFLLNTQWSAEELDAKLPGQAKRHLANNGIRMFTIDAVDIAQRLGLGSHTNTVLQAAFFKISGLMDVDAAVEQMKAAVAKSYARMGDAVVARNIAAIDEGIANVHGFDIPASWATAPDTVDATDYSSMPRGMREFMLPASLQKANDLPVSTFLGYEDGTFDMGFTAYEKRGIAVRTPKWNPTTCIQCNRCALACPHAAIRSYLLDDGEVQAAPAGFATAAAKGKQAEGLSYTLQVSEFDCTGCGSCASVCPTASLDMSAVELTEERLEDWNYGLSIEDKGDLFDPYTVKGSQFRQPLLEFSAACAGCGETPYAKLLTQLFGESIYWANATGCSQAWGSGEPGIPYTKNKRGFGPAWTNSLFENNAELAYGMYLSSTHQREAERMRVQALLEALTSADAASDAQSEIAGAIEAIEAWSEKFDDFSASRALTDTLVGKLEALIAAGGEDGTDAVPAEVAACAADVLKHKDQLAKKTFWMFGGDGWAYDIGFGGLDHVISTGNDFNVLIVDTEVYSNTGGQSSKATPAGAVAEFAASGKKTHKKDLGAILMSYGNVYVAQVAMGADPNQLLRAIKEAVEYNGPSVIIAYAPCTAHGLLSGMANVQDEMKRASQSGYWTLYRYDPRKEHPMTLDTKKLSLDYIEFLEGEARYASLRKSFPEEAERLFAAGKEDALRRYGKYQGMAEQ